MKKITDRIFLDLICGVVTGFPGRMLNTLEYHLGITDVKYGQTAANLFLPKDKVNTKEAQITGSLTNHIGLGVLGSSIVYLLSATGRDYAAIKGMGIGASAWVAVYGLAVRFGVEVRSKKPLAPVLSFIDHALFGALCGVLVSKLGDDSLFPNPQVKKDKIPLFYTDDEFIQKR